MDGHPVPPLRRAAPFLLAGLVLAAVLPVRAQHGVSFAAFGGTAFNLRTNLTIRQAGQPDISLSARYDTHALEMPPYYAWRIAVARRTGSWEVQFIHHKIHLSNTPDAVHKFEVTHGFNLLTLNWARPVGPVTLRVGGGAVIAHAESVIRGMSNSGQGSNLDGGYHLTGPAVLLGVGKEFDLSKRWFLALDAQVIAGWAHVPVAEGWADAPDVALHALVGVGFRF